MSVRAVPEGVLVEVRVRPRSRPGWEISAGGLVIGVAAAPVGGVATEEARRALAKDPRRDAQPGVAASRPALSYEGVRGRRCGRRGSEGGAQEVHGRTPESGVMTSGVPVRRQSAARIAGQPLLASLIAGDKWATFAGTWTGSSMS
jgi:hypothetical protein